MIKSFIAVFFCFWSLTLSDHTFATTDVADIWNIEQVVSDNSESLDADSLDEFDDNDLDAAFLQAKLLIAYAYQQHEYFYSSNPLHFTSVSIAIIRAPPVHIV